MEDESRRLKTQELGRGMGRLQAHVTLQCARNAVVCFLTTEVP